MDLADRGVEAALETDLQGGAVAFGEVDGVLGAREGEGDRLLAQHRPTLLEDGVEQAAVGVGADRDDRGVGIRGSGV